MKNSYWHILTASHQKFQTRNKKGIQMEMKEDNSRCYDTSVLSRSFERGGRFLQKYKADEKWAVVSPMTHHVIRDQTTPPPVPIRRQRSRSFGDYVDMRPSEITLLLPPMKPHHEESKNSPHHQNSQQIPKTRVTKNKSLVKKDNPIWISIMYGLINATIVLPVVMSFGNIIYQNEFFEPYMPVLIKLTLVSGVIHQLCFSSLSSLKFAVGSVQDAGLIFLSAMATDMVTILKSHGHKDETILATVTICLGLAAAILGMGLIVLGRLRLAGYVQLLPTSVIAGYLAYIGFFCGKSGVYLMAGTSELEVLWNKIVLILPGIVGGLLIYVMVRIIKHVAVLPVGIIVLLAMFYLALMVSNTSIEDATERGWIREAEPAPIWYHTWDYLRFGKVQWSVVPHLLLSEVSMILVVALSSSLDVAAIELEMKTPLNYNGELIMVGISNVISGLTGGYTGSYIFSQTIFSLRAGVQERLSGFVLAAAQIAVIVTPFPILTYVPNFFYGSLLSMICIDLVYEWLWDFRSKATTAEYVIGLCTFGLINALGVEYGIIAGLFAYIFCRQLGINVGELKQVYTEEEKDETQLESPPSLGLDI